MRRAPQRPDGQTVIKRPDKLKRRDGDDGGKKFPPRGDAKPPKKEFSKESSSENKSFAKGEKSSEKKPIQRHIIPQDIYENKGSGRKRSDGKRKDKDFNSKKEEQERISLEKAAAQKHKKRVHKDEEVAEVKQIVVNQAMTISELSEKIHKTPAEIVKFLMLHGVMATVNQLIDVDVIKQICAEYNLEVLDEDLDAYIEEEMEKEQKHKALTEVDKKLLKKRAPVVSIMGHVDHGKTTLLDSIRASKHKIVATEVGGITQSIGAYTVYLDNNKEKKIVFVDTPGHEAFTEMRARGAKATDIAILVVAADDGIMPQTIEAISHARAAEVPIIVAVNKIDKPGANPDKILQQLTEHGLVPEEWGGDTITVKVSALNGTGIDELLEYILLVADIQDLKANPKAEASGVVIEANLDKGKGPVATLLVQNGTLRVGNCIVVGTACGRVRALLSDSGEKIQKAEPSTPVEILGLTEVPQHSASFCKLMFMFTMVDALQGPLWVSVQATGKIRNYQILMSILILSSVPVSYVLLKFIKVAEVILAVRVLANVVTAVARVIYLRKLLDFPIARYLKEVIAISLIVTAIAVVAPCVTYECLTGWAKVAVSVIVAILSTALTVFFIGMKRNERNFVLKTLKQFAHRP